MDACVLHQRKNDADLSTQVTETAKDIVQTCRQTVSSTTRLVAFDSLPEWMKDNEFLRNGHRLPIPSFRHSFRSIFHIHTETGNIWTHLLGFLFISFLAIFSFCQSSFGSAHFWMKKYLVVRELPPSDQVMFGSFFAGALLCLLASSLFHTFVSHSHKINKLFSRLDYAGISFLITGSDIASFYYTFYCHPHLRTLYVTASVVLGITCIVVFFWDRCLTFRILKGVLFSAFGLLGIVPLMHSVYVNGFDIAMKQSAVSWMVLMALAYLSGAAFYMARIPERFFPGKCDIYVQSHQIFHMYAIAGIVLFYWALLTMAEYRHMKGPCQG
eukprot:m.162044 g.162044  ORF g.162044 m.162044 type:complete len:327 (+) comp38828_c0_seq2:66-1046(+)